MRPWHGLIVCLALGCARGGSRTSVDRHAGASVEHDGGAGDAMTTKQGFFTRDDFVAGFGRELRIASEIHQSMVAKGMKDHCLARFDFTFVSDEKAKLERLRDFLLS